MSLSYDWAFISTNSAKSREKRDWSKIATMSQNQLPSWSDDSERSPCGSDEGQGVLLQIVALLHLDLRSRLFRLPQKANISNQSVEQFHFLRSETLMLQTDSGRTRTLDYSVLTNSRESGLPFPTRVILTVNHGESG